VRVTMLVRCLAMMRGGGETRHLAWARELAALGVDVDIIAGAPLVGAARFAINEVRASTIRSPYTRDFVYRFQNRRGFGRLTMNVLHLDEEWFCRAAWNRMSAGEPRPDVVHAHALHQAARLRVGNIPVVINLPGPPNPRYVGDLQHADALVADGWAADNLSMSLGRSIDHVQKGVDVELFTPHGADLRAHLGVGTAPVIVTVARLVPLKNISLLIEAFATVRRRLAAARLVIVGEGPERPALEREAGRLGVADGVVFAGRVDHADTPDWFRSADAFVLSSDFDNSPNAVLEAMACARPIVATDVGGVRALVGNGPGALLVPRRDPAALASAIASTLTSLERARADGMRNRARALTEFSWRASALRLLSVYDRVIAERGGGARASA